MASYIDLGSSPDPLGDDDDMDLLPTSSMRPPPSRRANTKTKTISTGHTSMLSLPDNDKSRFSAPRTSPRKQTFELDVGDERSPQRLLVTVEANEAMANATQRSMTNRRLFGGAAPSSSPARSRSVRREISTTTRVPLRGLSDDEAGALGNDMNTPRKRGRPLGSKNGTPAPQGRKRSGTPLARMSPAKTRQRKNPESEMSMFSSDAQLDMGTDAVDPEDEPTPKAKPVKARKNTPAAKRAGGTPAAVPSSKPTGRKRGRPRKALNPDEMAMLTSELDNREINSDLLLPSEDPRMNDAPSEMEAIPEGNEESYSRHELAPSTSPPRDEPGNRSPPPNEEPASDNQDIADLIDQLVNEGQEEEPGNNHSYGAMREAESDDESDGAAGSEATYGKTDTLDHASDFSIIAIESLPSFQASFQASQNGGSRFGNSQQSRFAQSGDETNFMINRSLRAMNSSAQGGEPPRFAEGGDETNFMINQSLRSLRGPPQEEEEPARQEKSQPVSSARKPASSAQKPSSSAHNYSSPSNYVMSSPQTWTKSPKRPKHTPLSRQVFGKKGAPNTGDSFSSIPDSVLRDATPGKAMARPTHVEEHETEDAEMHDDSFSELPDEVLEAATPGPSTRTTRNPAGADNPGSQLFSADVHSAARSTNNAFGSTRLPTPDDTNSSTTGSKNAHEDESRNPSKEPSTAAVISSDLIMQSSPPRIGVQHADDVDMEQPAQSDGNAVGTPSPQNSSPSPEYPRITKLGSPGLGDLLQPPMSTRRPTLSPIVRVGRSLQHVMSDRSSPDGRESSLGSPFRRSGSGDSRQSSVQKSPVNERHETFHQSASKSAIFNPIANLAQSIRANFSQVSQHGPTPSISGRVDDRFGADRSQLPPAADSFDKSMASAPPSSRRHTLQGAPSEQFPLLTSSARADPPSEAFPDWNGENSSPTAQRTRRMSAPRQFPSMNSSNLFGARAANTSRVEPVQEDVAKEEEIEDEPLQAEEHDDIQQEDEQDFSESEQEQFEGGDDMGYDEEESIHDSVDQEEEQDAVNDQLQSEAGDDQRSQGQIEEEEEEDEDEEALEQSVERDVSEDESEHGRADQEPARDDRMETQHEFDEKTGEQHSFDESLESQPTFDMGDDGMDLWDIEASRPTPKSTKSTKLIRAERRARRQSQVDVIARSSQSREASLLQGSTDGGPSRRKVPSPWKKNTRRLIYQDDFKSPAHIEMDGSTQSESPEEEFSLIAQLTAEDNTPMRQEQSRSQPQQLRQGSSREDNKQGNAEFFRGEALAQLEEAMSPEQPYNDRSSPSPAPEQPYHQQSSPSPAPEPAKEAEEYSMLAQQKQEQEVAKPPENPPAKRRSGLFGAFDIMSFFSSPAPLPTANTPGGAPETATRPIPKPFVRAQAQSSAAKSQPEEPQSVLRATGLFPSIPQKTQKTLFRPSPQRTIDLFRSSPERQSNLSRSSPENQTDVSRSSPQHEADLPQSNPERETSRSQPNPERTVDLFSPATALRSGDTVADTYAETPSTPERERQEFPHIPQKQNFTPRSGRSRNTASLFTPSVAPSTPDRDRMAEGDDVPEQEEQEYYQREQESDDYDGEEAAGHDDSVMTVETDYERLPPREQPSKWDKNASPAKSCLRSPLKPKTPGRVVEWAGIHDNNRTVSPSEQIESWMMGRQALGSVGTGGNSLGQGQGRPRPQFAGFEDEKEEEEFDQADKENSPSPPKESNHFPPQFAVNNNSQRAMSPAKQESNNFPVQFAGNNSNGQRAMSPAKAVVAPPNIKMPATTIFRAPVSLGQSVMNGIKPLISLQPFSRAAATNGNGALTGNNTGNSSSISNTSSASNSTSNSNGAGNSDSASGINNANGISSTERNDSTNGINSANGTSTNATNAENTLTWLKSDWIHLDELLQLRRNEPAKFRRRQARSHEKSQNERGSSEDPPPRRRCSIVDVFRDEVGAGRCWDEKTLAKRLFALIVGEERRWRGIATGATKGKKDVAA
ncbi:hypothetical protein PG988_006059 [Apiospora saccharicola]